MLSIAAAGGGEEGKGTVEGFGLGTVGGGAEGISSISVGGEKTLVIVGGIAAGATISGGCIRPSNRSCASSTRGVLVSLTCCEK